VTDRTDRTDRRRRTFGPVVLVGLATAGLTAIAGHKPWLGFDAGTVVGPGSELNRPEVESVALVVLAAWGVLLVTRGKVRRAIALLAAVAALAAAGLAVHGLLEHGSSTTAVSSFSFRSVVHLHRTAWGFLALGGALVSAVAALAAFRLAPGWPEMGRKYDAPAGGPTPALPLEEQSSLDVWKAFDAGHDPTAEPPPDRSE
jgi:hypothetical protein